MKLGKVGPNIPFLPIFSLIYPYLSLFTYRGNLASFTLIWSYLPINALNWPYVPYSPYIMYSNIETAQILEQSEIIHSDIAFKRIWVLI